MVPEEQEQAEELQNNFEVEAEETLEQSEVETEPRDEEGEVEVTPPVISEEAIKEAQRRFTPAQQRLADELRQEREQRQAIEAQLRELREKATPPPPKEPEEPEPDPVMDPAGYNRWLVRQEIRPLLEKQRESEERLLKQERQQRFAADEARICEKYSELKNPDSPENKAFVAFLNSSDPEDQHLVSSYRDGKLSIERLYKYSQGTGIEAAAEKRVKEDLVRKAKAQVSPPKSGGPKEVRYDSYEDAVLAAIREVDQKGK